MKSNEKETKKPSLFQLLEKASEASEEALEKVAFHVLAAHEYGPRLHHLKSSELKIWRQDLFPCPYFHKGCHLSPSEYTIQKDTALLFFADDDDSIQEKRMKTAMEFAQSTPENQKKLDMARANIKEMVEKHLNRVIDQEDRYYPMSARDYQQFARRNGITKIPIQIMSEHGGIDYDKFVDIEHETIFPNVGLFAAVLYRFTDSDLLPQYVATFNFGAMRVGVFKKGKPHPADVYAQMQYEPFRIDQVIKL